MTTLQGKVAVITGSARNIGRACAIELARQGVKVVVNARTRDKVLKVVEEIRQFGGEALPNYDSVGTLEGSERIIQTAIDGFGSIDILVNNAAIINYGPLHETSPERWEEVINVNLIGPYRCCRAALPYMVERGWGRIINMTAHAGLEGGDSRSSYAASKGGVNALTKSIAREYGNRGITANAIAPFVIIEKETGPLEYPDTIYGQEFFQDKRNIASPKTVIPKKGTPKEIAAMVAFFASEEAWYITGQVISVGGGRWMM